MQITKHIGIEPSTNSRIALIIPVLEGTDHCLIVYVDRLPRDLKDGFDHVLNSSEGQAAQKLADVLSRRLYSDTKSDYLATLHNYKFLVKAPIDSIEMTPMPSIKLPLRTVLVESGLIPRPIAEAVDKFNPHLHNSTAATHGETLGTARNMLIEAKMLEDAARTKRDEAYRLAPSLRPEEPTTAPQIIADEANADKASADQAATG
jgi:hypothetical protein